VTGEVIDIHAPFAGVLRHLADVPDPAFAQGLVGEGIAIDPLGETVCAPFDAEVIARASTGHSVTLRHRRGIEVLIHLGIDTVALKGRGFEPLVAVGQRVVRGEPLLRFDADIVAAGAASLVTPVLVIGGAGSPVAVRSSGTIARGDLLLRVTVQAGAAPIADQGLPTAHLFVTLALPHGLHARPSARLAEFAREQQGALTVTFAGRTADASSTTALMALDARHGDEVEVRAVGERAREIALAVADLLETLGRAETDAVAQADAKPVAPAIARIPAPAAAGRIAGTVASPGLARGPVHRLNAGDLAVAAQGAGMAHEASALRIARKTLAARNVGEGAAAEIARAHRAILEDDALIAAAERAIAGGASAAAAWRTASRSQEDVLAASDNPRMRERAIDLRDVERQVIAALSGSVTAEAALPPSGAIVVGVEIAPSFLIALPPGRVAGICTAQGGTTSHAAILAGAAGIPMLVAAGDDVLALEDGRDVVLDAENGWLDPAPSDALRVWLAQEQARRVDAHAVALAEAAAECRLSDGTRVEVFANLGAVAEAQVAVAQGAEGCGLLRTEFLFAEAAQAPDEESQRASYRAIADALGGRPLIVRTLDVGGDKPLAYLPLPAEENPALGLRGVRVSLHAPDLLRTQLRAILRGVPPAQLRIMVPMVVDAGELAAVRRIAEEECAALGDVPLPPIGIMVETPAAALLADQLAQVADFLSIGSNDLTQYVLAMDRGNAALVSRVDALHPAVLEAIALTGAAARRHDRWLGLCGSLASDPRAAPLLVGLGCVELSGVPRAVPEIKRTLARWSDAECRRLAERARALRSAEAVRVLLMEEAR
jgi:phosphoenolpyruvate-protein phosphotransferase